MRLYLIRHGETEWNAVRRLQGQSDIDLNENGRALAKVTARALQNVPFDLAISSPLIRALDTAKLVLEGRNIPIICDERIKEISFGTLEGKQYKNEAGEVLYQEFDLFFHKPDQYAAPEQGESLQSLVQRVGEFLKDITGQPEYQNKTILVSTHGAASRAVLCAIKNIELKDFWGPGVPPNCAVTILEYENGNWEILEQDKIYYENVRFLF